MGMVAAGDALCVPGNHENKLLRALRGRKVQVTHGLAESLAQLAAEPEEFRADVERFLDGLISHYVLDGGQLVVSHAGLIERYQGRASGRVREFCLYGQTTGETDEYGLPVRYPWAQEYRGRAMVAVRPHPGPRAGVDQQHPLPGHRLRLRRPADRAALPGTGDSSPFRPSEVYYEPARPFPVNPTAAVSDAARSPRARGPRHHRRDRAPGHRDGLPARGSGSGRRTPPPRSR